MKPPSKVLWAEGSALRVQQFQQQDRYHESRLQRTVSAMYPHGWGVRAIAWNREALAHKRLRADAMSLIFQDGEVVDAPGPDRLPPAFDLALLDLSRQSFTFFAALPFFKHHGGNLERASPAQAGAARFEQAEHDTPDLFNEAAQVRIAYLNKKLELLPDSVPRNAHENFPVIRLVRLPGGGFDIDPSFMAPSLAIGAAPALSQQLDALMHQLGASAGALLAHGRQGTPSACWLLPAISRSLACLSHYAHCRSLHPERLFLELLACAGGLMAGSAIAALADLPHYDHADPAPAFLRLGALIGELLDSVIEARPVAIEAALP